MKILNWLKNVIYMLFKEETYEEDFRRNFSVKYSGLRNIKGNY